MRSLFRSHAPVAAPVIEPVPTVFPKMDGADIAAVFAGKRVAGDFYDSVRVSPERVLFGLLDVAGRRDETRSLLKAAQEIFRKYGTELFSRPDINESDAMTQLSRHLNRGLIDLCSGVHPCPAFIACYQEKFGTLCYTNAGHTPGLLRDHHGIVQIASTGLPLGLFSHATSEAPIMGIEKGAVLLLISRGVIECESLRQKSSGEFGLARAQDVLQAAAVGSARALCTYVLDAVEEFAAGSPLCDDQTALALVRTG
jgi:serine phosphatase RsbU (regulator of sigma subunit)